MKRVQHDEVKPGMTIRNNASLIGRWVVVHEVYERVPNGPHVEGHAKLRVSYLSGRDKRHFQLNLYRNPGGYELHPESALQAAQEGQRKGRADFVQNVVLREYSIKFVAVDRVDNEGMACGYCDHEQGRINCNIYATTTTESGGTENEAWSSCDACVLRSIDQVEDVDPAHVITIERSQSR